MGDGRRTIGGRAFSGWLRLLFAIAARFCAPGRVLVIVGALFGGGRAGALFDAHGFRADATGGFAHARGFPAVNTGSYPFFALFLLSIIRHPGSLHPASKSHEDSSIIAHLFQRSKWATGHFVSLFRLY